MFQLTGSFPSGGLDFGKHALCWVHLFLSIVLEVNVHVYSTREKQQQQKTHQTLKTRLLEEGGKQSNYTSKPAVMR